jgi:hypothetical protein
MSLPIKRKSHRHTRISKGVFVFIAIGAAAGAVGATNSALRSAKELAVGLDIFAIFVIDMAAPTWFAGRRNKLFIEKQLKSNKKKFLSTRDVTNEHSGHVY